MAPSIQTLTALAALLIAVPSASALAASDAPLTSSLPNDAAYLDPALELAGGAADNAANTATDAINLRLKTLDGPVGTVQGALDDATKMLSCRPAIHVMVDWYEGTVTETRNRAGDFFVAHKVERTVTEQVPRYETVTQTVWQGASILDPVLPPITETVTRIVGYDTVTTVREVVADLAVSATWKQSYVVWSSHRDDWYVSPLAVIPDFDGVRSGPLQLVCDPAVQVHDAVPTPWDYDGGHVCLCDEQPDDGWYTRILSVRVRLASAEEYNAYLSGGLLIAPTDIMELALLQAGRLDFSDADLARQAQERADAGQPDAQVLPTGASAAPQGSICTILGVPLSASAVLGLLGATVLSILGLAGKKILRRKA